MYFNASIMTSIAFGVQFFKLCSGWRAGKWETERGCDWSSKERGSGLNVINICMSKEYFFFFIIYHVKSIWNKQFNEINMHE